MMSLAQVAKVLVQHGINHNTYNADDREDLARFVKESCSVAGCSVRALKKYLGY